MRLTGAHARTRRLRAAGGDLRRGLAAVALGLACAASAHAQSGGCHNDPQKVAEAVAAIRRAVDPCGESPQMLDVLNRLERCPQTTYRVCTSTEIDRNLFDRPRNGTDEPRVATISWNPELRSELEATCEGNPAWNVRRDPAASLLHELVHALQECEGVNPGEHELEAVRIENIYRRGAGLCQRSGYGDQLLPAEMVRVCRAGNCPCSMPRRDPHLAEAGAHAAVVAGTRDARADERHGDIPE